MQLTRLKVLQICKLSTQMKPSSCYEFDDGIYLIGYCKEVYTWDMLYLKVICQLCYRDHVFHGLFYRGKGESSSYLIQCKSVVWSWKCGKVISYSVVKSIPMAAVEVFKDGVNEIVWITRTRRWPSKNILPVWYTWQSLCFNWGMQGYWVHFWQDYLTKMHYYPNYWRKFHGYLCPVLKIMNMTDIIRKIGIFFMLDIL